MKNKISLFLILFLLFSSAVIARSPKNIIILIGDGMGINQVQAAYTQNGGYLNMTNRCPFSGLRQTNSANKYTTDSAAGGTAIACGEKTNNGMVGMSADSIPMNSIIRLATLKGMSTGVISTSSITDATPASFVAHQPVRSMQDEIAEDFLNSDISLFIGGGLKFFEKRKIGVFLINLQSNMRVLIKSGGIISHPDLIYQPSYIIYIMPIYRSDIKR